MRIAGLVATLAAPATAQDVDPYPYAPAFDACLASVETGAAATCIGAASGPCRARLEPMGGDTAAVACLDMEAKLWDAALAVALDMAGSYGTEAPGAAQAELAEALAVSQSAWTAHRDARCDLAHALDGPVAASGCRARLTAERVADLRGAFGLAP